MTVHQQKKALAPGNVRTWDLDLETMANTAGWARANPGLLVTEVEKILEAFPTLLAAVGIPLPEDECWVEAAEPLLCDDCGELIVFDQGTRCARCRTPTPAPPGAVVGFVGRIPAQISGRPLKQSLERRLARLRQTGDARLEMYSRAIIQVQDSQYIAPRYGLWFSRSWPHEDPPVMVWPEYFDMLGIPPDHVYMATPYFRLCLYASWVEQPAVNVLQNRVAPRLLIDLMMADLNAQGKLDTALDRLETTLYQVYNMVGDPALKAVYEELVR